MVPQVAELAVAVILAGERHPVVTPGQQAAVLHHQRGVPGTRTGIAGQFRCPLDHLLHHVAVLPVDRPPVRLLPWFHATILRSARLNPRSPRREVRPRCWPGAWLLPTRAGRHSRIWPVPQVMFLTQVSASRPIGPRACSFWVDTPISRP